AVVGALALLASTLLASILLRGTRHPKLGLSVFAASDVADLLCGRVTFACGVALAMAGLLLTTRRRPVLAALLAALACLASPVAGVLLLVPLAAIAWCDRARRAASLVAGGASLAVLLALHWAFPLRG